MTALQRTKNYVEKGIATYAAPVPKWAKWCRNAGIVATIIGSQILVNPDIYPPGFGQVAPYMINVGGIATAIFQAFKKR